MNPQIPRSRANRSLPWLLCALTGFGAGLLNGLLGAAGGILLVAVLPRLTPPAVLYPPRRPLGDFHARRDPSLPRPASVAEPPRRRGRTFGRQAPGQAARPSAQTHIRRRGHRRGIADDRVIPRNP